jgi:hypothetical protein
MSNFKMDDSYNEVASRIQEFRAKHPEGSLQPADPSKPYEVVTVGDRTYIVYVAAAYRTPEDPRPGIGIAWEAWPGRTPYTRDSELMNAETSAWGRALVAVGAADAKKGIASAEEVANRRPARVQDRTRAEDSARDASATREVSGSTQVSQSDTPDHMTDPQRRRLMQLCKQAGLTEREQRLAHCSAAVGRELATANDLTAEEAGLIIAGLELVLSEQHQENP